jgi:hypothetical protein
MTAFPTRDDTPLQYMSPEARQKVLDEYARVEYAYANRQPSGYFHPPAKPNPSQVMKEWRKEQAKRERNQWKNTPTRKPHIAIVSCGELSGMWSCICPVSGLWGAGRTPRAAWDYALG